MLRSCCSSAALPLVLAILVVRILSAPAAVSAASAFADPAFQAQWQQGEALASNFWGPLANAKDGGQEPYKEASGGQRLVQYFDKGRMELTNGTVTNGLLASEIIKGQIQTGDATFQSKDPPAIPIAGDPDSLGPTYASLKDKAAMLLAPTSAQVGTPVSTLVAADGTVSSGAGGNGPATTIAAFDDATKHNVPQAFSQYRSKAGLLTIGLAISEPFLTTVKVAGQQKPVMVQVFERRILTYTATNDPAFQVEMGNIGQHYFQWRYPNGAPAVAPSGTGLTTWADSNGLIRLQYPSTWTTDTTPDANLPHKAVLVENPANGDEGMFVTIADSTGQFNDEATQIARSLMRASQFDFHVHNATNVTVGGEAAWNFVVDMVSKSNSSDVREFEAWIVHHNGKSFSLQANYRGARPAAIGAIIASVVFLT